MVCVCVCYGRQLNYARSTEYDFLLIQFRLMCRSYRNDFSKRVHYEHIIKPFGQFNVKIELKRLK